MTTSAPTLRPRPASFSGGRADLIVCLGYGPELPVYARARALWQFYASHFPSIQFYFVREATDLGCGEIRFDGHDVVIGIGDKFRPSGSDAAGYAETGVWSNIENQRSVFRQVSFYDYLLRSRDAPFYVYQSTITSVVDFRSVLAIMDTLPATQCYSGMPGIMTGPPEIKGLSFACGTNGIISSDLLATMRNRYEPGHAFTNLPQDLWQALVLQDVPRIALPFFSFVNPRADVGIDSNVAEMTRRLLAHGHYHFRVKSDSAAAGLAAREDIDPWIMLEVMKTVLASQHSTDAALGLKERLTRSLNPNNGETMTAYGEEKFFSGPRDFPLNDTETESLYPDLVRAP